MRKQIIYVWNYKEWGGVQIYFLTIMRKVRKTFFVRAVLPSDSDEKLLSYFRKNNLEFEFFDGKIELGKVESLKDRIARRINDILCNVALAKHLSKKDLRNAILHVDIAPWSNFAFYVFLLRRTDVFLTLHTPLPDISEWRGKLWKAKLAILTNYKNFHLVASNHKVKSSLKKFVAPEFFDLIRVGYSSVNLEEINAVERKNSGRNQIAVRYNLPSEKFWLVNVGQFINRKGCWVLLEALARLAKKRKDFFFYWLGTSSPEIEIAERIKDYGLEENFRFFSDAEIGGERADLLNFMAAAHLFVMPSLEEGLPVALIEAMALEKCCIASNIDAIPEAIEHLETGYLIAPDNVGEIVNAIEILLENERLREKIGSSARKKIITEFSDETLADTMIELYTKAFEK